MRDVPSQVNGGSTLLDAGDYNNVQGELETLITSTGQTLDPTTGPDTDTAMLRKAAADYASGGDFYTDTGAVDAYVLSRATSLNAASALLDGMRVAFYTTNASTGAATVNVTTFGVKDIRKVGGAVLPAGYIRTDVLNVLRYDSGNGYFELETSGLLDSLAAINGSILGDGTAGRVLRKIRVNLQDGTNASTLRALVANEWNGDAIAGTDNIAKGATTGDFTLDSLGRELSFPVTGDCIAVLAAVVNENLTSTYFLSPVSVSGTDLLVSIQELGASQPTDMTSAAAVDAGDIRISILYLTSA